jgi:hypothetical protein
LEGILSTRSEELRSLVRPWGEAWQRWKEIPARDGGGWALESEAATVEALVKQLCIVVLPARLVCAHLSWAPAGQSENVFESAQLQMEVAGLLTPQVPVEQAAFAVLTEQETRQLVRGILFPPDWAVPVRADYEAFIPSPLALKLPGRALCLWQEGAFLVACLTADDGAAVVWESCPLPDGSATLRGWLEIFLLELEAQEFPAHPAKVCDYTGLADTPELLGLPVEKPSPPAPEPPTPLPIWAPPAVVDARARVLSRRQWTHAITAAAAGALLVAVVIGGYLAAREWQIRSLRAQVEELSASVEPSIAIARQWDLLEMSIDPDLFALEKLLLAVTALPADGVRLSLFEALPESVRIEGDARNVGLATLYFNSLQAQEGAEGFTWSMPSPVLQPDNSARFAIDATRQP